MANNQSRALLCFPYLPLREPYLVGQWNVLPLSQFNGDWATPDYETQVRTFLQGFRDPQGNSLKNPAILVSKARGMDGSIPSPHTRRCIQQAVTFATIDANPLPGTDNAGLFAGTSDNADLFGWNLDPVDGYIAIQRGAIVTVLSGGHKIDNALNVPAPLELAMPFDVVLDQQVIAAVYGLGTRRFSKQSYETRNRIQTAIGWLAKAWRNTTSIAMADRVVMLKTGFEALTGTSDSWDSSVLLRQLFEIQLSGRSAAECDDLLWSPSETRRFVVLRGKKQNPWPATDLQDWFVAFTYARNAIIHKGELKYGRYRKPKSSYNGHFVFVAERLLREAIRVSLMQFGYSDIWKTSASRSSDAMVAAVMAVLKTGNQRRPVI